MGRSLALRELQKERSLGDYLFAAGESGENLEPIAQTRTKGYLTPVETALWQLHEYERQILLIAKHCRRRDDESRLLRVRLDLHPHEHVPLEDAGRIRYQDSNRSGLGV